MKTRLLIFFGLPFVIAAAFKFTDWAGWPTLLVLGLIWLGTCANFVKD